VDPFPGIRASQATVPAGDTKKNDGLCQQGGISDLYSGGHRVRNNSEIISLALCPALSLHLTMSTSTFSSAHRIYVKSLYKRYLTNALDWTVRRDLWRAQAMQIRAEFEQNRCVAASAFESMSHALSLQQCARPTGTGGHPRKGRGRSCQQETSRSIYL
jgi:hypothetical protein